MTTLPPAALEACPFCGGADISHSYVRDGRKMFCVGCGASITRFNGPNNDTVARLTEAWNTRAARSTVPEAGKALPSVEVHPADTLPSGDEFLISKAFVHEGAIIALYGTNDKMIGWIDTNAWTKGRVYRDQLLPPASVPAPEAGKAVVKLVVYEAFGGRRKISVDASMTEQLPVGEYKLYTAPVPPQAVPAEEIENG